MEKKNIDWSNLGFGYTTTDYRYVSMYREGRIFYYHAEIKAKNYLGDRKSTRLNSSHCL